MSIYEDLAREMFGVIIESPVPPVDKVNASMRGEMAVMNLLNRENRMMTAGEISKKLNMTTARIAAVLNSLEKKHMIERCMDEKDKRRVKVSLTGNGESFCERRKEEALSHMEKMLMHLGDKDAPEFVRLMKRIYEILIIIGPPDMKEKEDREEKQI